MADTNGTKTIRDRILEWLFQQGVSTVLLVAILSLLSYFGNYELREGGPQRLKEIQAGYERQALIHERIETANREAFKEALSYILRAEVGVNRTPGSE